LKISVCVDRGLNPRNQPFEQIARVHTILNATERIVDELTNLEQSVSHIVEFVLGHDQFVVADAKFVASTS
jgi:hypothetical protein